MAPESSSLPDAPLAYVSTPITYTQPAWIAAQARLRGLEAPDPRTARVLEIGAASGGNLIPLAARFPQARFTGFDLSGDEARRGAGRVERLGLTNIRLEAGDVRTFAPDPEGYDYVICHGVYSWAPRDAQQAILRLAGASLAAQGIAAVSYNVLPGAHLRLAVREACRTLVDPTLAPMAQAAAAREVLARIAEATSPNEAYGVLMRSEAKRLRRRPAAYILGEILAPVNDPCTVGAFASAAQAAGLMMVGEADLPSSLHAGGGAHALALATSLSGGDAIAFQGALDIVTGRPFRRTLLARAADLSTALPAACAERLRGLHVASPGRPHVHGLPADDPSLADIPARLAAAYPATVPVNDLATGGDSALSALFAMVSSGRATVTTVPLAVGRADAERPKLFAIAREEAQGPQPWVSTLQHMPALIDAPLRRVAPYLDGISDCATLAARLREAGESDPDATLARVLAYAERCALLEP